MIDRFSNDVVFFFFIRVVDHYRPKVYVDMWGPSSESGLSLRSEEHTSELQSR